MISWWKLLPMRILSKQKEKNCTHTLSEKCFQLKQVKECLPSHCKLLVCTHSWKPGKQPCKPYLTFNGMGRMFDVSKNTFMDDINNTFFFVVPESLMAIRDKTRAVKLTTGIIMWTGDRHQQTHWVYKMKSNKPDSDVEGDKPFQHKIGKEREEAEREAQNMF